MTRLLLTPLRVVMNNVHADEAGLFDKDCRIMMAWFPLGLRQSEAGLL